jgi:ADP-ribose pyrophosphatase YjhB (NUDIX family)
MRALALVWNLFPARWQRRFLDASHDRFLVGVLKRAESVEGALERELREETKLTIEIGPIVEVVTGHRWQHVDVVLAYRVTGGTPALSGEVAELRGFALDDLPAMRADQRGIVERHGQSAIEWARRRG